MVDVTNDLAVERRKKERERMAVIKAGDISKALRSMRLAEELYKDMCRNFDAWAKSTRDAEKARREGIATLQAFGKNAERLMGDSMRVLLLDLYDEVSAEDVNIVTDDVKWTTLLARIANADTMNAMKMTKAAYKLADETLASFESKITGLKRKTQLGGATEAEEGTASMMLERLYHAKEVIEKRKDVLVETNLKMFAAVKKFADAHLVSNTKPRKLTKKERDAIEGLV